MSLSRSTAFLRQTESWEIGVSFSERESSGEKVNWFSVSVRLDLELMKLESLRLNGFSEASERVSQVGSNSLFLRSSLEAGNNEQLILENMGTPMASWLLVFRWRFECSAVSEWSKSESFGVFERVNCEFLRFCSKFGREKASLDFPTEGRRKELVSQFWFSWDTSVDFWGNGLMRLNWNVLWEAGQSGLGLKVF